MRDELFDLYWGKNGPVQNRVTVFGAENTVIGFPTVVCGLEQIPESEKLDKYLSTM